jgi:hypothetical protein
MASLALATLQTREIGELVRMDARVIGVLVDLGISPRYLHWTVTSVAEELGVSVARIVDLLSVVLAREDVGISCG